jgi:hypothetical protein
LLLLLLLLLQLLLQQISDLFNLIDVEGRGTGVSPASKIAAGMQAPLKSGGFDLVYHNGFVETDPKVNRVYTGRYITTYVVHRLYSISYSYATSLL